MNMDTNDESDSTRSRTPASTFVSNVLRVKSLQTMLVKHFGNQLPPINDILKQSSSRCNYDDTIEQSNLDNVYLARSQQFGVANLIGVFAKRDFEPG